MALPNLGNIRNGNISRERLVVVHSEGKKARKLEGSQSSEARLTMMKILGWPLGERTRDFLVDVHLGFFDLGKLRISGNLDEGDRILWGFTLAGGQYFTI